MFVHHAAVSDGIPALDDLAAELTSAAYSVALRRGLGDSWLDLELDLWRAVAATIKKRLSGAEPTG